MVTKEQVLELVREGETYESAGRRLGIPAGRAYMIATGIPADGSDSLGADDYRREGLKLGATQRLLGVPVHDGRRPGEQSAVMDWVRARAKAGRATPAAATPATATTPAAATPAGPSNPAARA